jgi:hypothetical protein
MRGMTLGKRLFRIRRQARVKAANRHPHALMRDCYSRTSEFTDSIVDHVDDGPSAVEVRGCSVLKICRRGWQLELKKTTL